MRTITLRRYINYGHSDYIDCGIDAEAPARLKRPEDKIAWVNLWREPRSTLVQRLRPVCHNDWPSAKATNRVSSPPISHPLLLSMAGFFKSIYDWLLRLFWYVPFAPALPSLPDHVVDRWCHQQRLSPDMRCRPKLAICECKLTN